MTLLPWTCARTASLLLLLAGVAYSQPFPKVPIAGSEVRTMKSASTGRSYDLYIHIPSDYAQNKDAKYPVLYILDGQ